MLAFTYKYIFLLGIILLCTSCIQNEKQEAIRLVKEWSGKEIKFPTKMDFINSSGQSVDFDFSTASHKVLVYVDSLGCTSCKLKLGQWKNLIDSLDKLAVPVLFIFQSKDAKSIKHVMLESSFEYPYFQDIQGVLNEMNQFSDDSRFQTFLLDSDSRVKLIGNPVYNQEMRRLYLEAVSGNSTDLLVLTTVEVDQGIIDLGEIRYEDKTEAIFTLKNTGEHSLVINNVSTSCGCTSAEYEKQPVPKGGELKIVAEIKPKDKGVFTETITVYTNTQSKRIALKIKGLAK